MAVMVISMAPVCTNMVNSIIKMGKNGGQP